MTVAADDPGLELRIRGACCQPSGLPPMELEAHVQGVLHVVQLAKQRLQKPEAVASPQQSDDDLQTEGA